MAKISSKTKTISVVAIVVALAIAIGIWATVTNSSTKAPVVASTQHHLTTISYQGQNGIDALTLLKKQAKVTTKHYSFGDQVISIDGIMGNGPKYWTFFINGKMASQGASSYITKNSDTLTWRLEK
ncbi:MAG: DUF4430 domain-containing protein [Candidatus Saccharimonadales bacterium]